jgi:hypothetical protein
MLLRRDFKYYTDGYGIERETEIVQGRRVGA